MKRTEPVAIASILDRLKKMPVLDRKLRESEAVRMWSEVVDEKCGALAKAILVKDGALCLKCDSSPLRQEIIMHGQELVQLINQQIGEKTIVAIKFI